MNGFWRRNFPDRTPPRSEPRTPDEATAASTDALRAAVNRMIAAADTDTRYWIENIIAQEGASTAASTDALRAALAQIEDISKAFDISMGGEETFHSLVPPKVKRIRDIARAALAATPPSDKAAWPGTPEFEESVAAVHEQHRADEPIVGLDVERNGWWHPADCSNQHTDEGNCLGDDGMVVGWRDPVEYARLSSPEGQEK